MKIKHAKELEVLLRRMAAAVKPQAATPEQAAALEKFFKMEQHNVHPGPDEGTCVLGNGISVLVLERGKRNPTRRKIFGNPWTQAEQSEALHKMIDAAKHKFPELKDFIEYEPGNMD